MTTSFLVPSGYSREIFVSAFTALISLDRYDDDPLESFPPLRITMCVTHLTLDPRLV